MLTEVKKNLSMVGAYFKMNLSASMEYRASFMIQVFGMFLNNASFAFFWWLLFDQVKYIAGYGFEDVMLLWAFSSTSFGIAFILFQNSRRIVEIVVKGELDSYLLQPKDVLLNVIASRTNVSAWGDFFYGIILLIIVRGFHLGDFMIFFVFTITGAIIFTSVMVTVNSLAFYFGNVESLATLVFEFLISLSIYPEGIFSGTVKVILFTAIPAGFISMVPVRLLHEFNLFWGMITILVALIWLVIAYVTFYKGLKRYESGNLMIQKL